MQKPQLGELRWRFSLSRSKILKSLLNYVQNEEKAQKEKK